MQVRLIERAELEKFNRLLDEHHYLGSQQAVGERLQYVATERDGEWLALLVFSAAAEHVKHRDQWIGWKQRTTAPSLELGNQQQPLSDPAPTWRAQSGNQSTTLNPGSAL